jgi:hypothetical protein
MDERVSDLAHQPSHRSLSTSTQMRAEYAPEVGMRRDLTGNHDICFCPDHALQPACSRTDKANHCLEGLAKPRYNDKGVCLY